MYQWVAIFYLFLTCVGLTWMLFRQGDKISLLKYHVGRMSADLAILKEKQGLRDGTVVEAITGNLDAELEKSAVMTEMRQAKRRTLPREDAGPPATVRRMKFYRGT